MFVLSPCCSGSIGDSPTAADDGFAVFDSPRIVNAVHPNLVREVGDVLQLLIWSSWDQSDSLQLVILFHGSSLVLDDAHVCGSVHRLIDGLFSI